MATIEEKAGFLSGTTYVAGLQIKTVIWIAAAFTEEHRAAMDWLNDATDDRYHFFGVEVELWRIGNSDPAPRFNIVVKPNDWSRSAAQAARTVQSGAMSELGQRRLAYWTAFKAFLEDKESFYQMDRGAKKGSGVLVKIQGAEAAEAYEQLSDRKAEIETALGGGLSWRESEAGKPYSITRQLHADPDDEGDWPRQFQFMMETMDAFTRVISPILEIPLDEGES